MIDFTKMTESLEGIKIYYKRYKSGGLADQEPAYTVKVLPERSAVGAHEAERMTLSAELRDWFDANFD